MCAWEFWIISLIYCGNVKYRTLWLENSMGGGILFLSQHEHEASTQVKVFLGIGKKKNYTKEDEG